MELARERPRETEPMTPKSVEEMARKVGRELHWQPLDELADLVVAGIKDEGFIKTLDLDKTGETLRSRAESIEKGELPFTNEHLG
jgi:hypothetical protein